MTKEEQDIMEALTKCSRCSLQLSLVTQRPYKRIERVLARLHAEKKVIKEVHGDAVAYRLPTLPTNVASWMS